MLTLAELIEKRDALKVEVDALLGGDDPTEENLERAEGLLNDELPKLERQITARKSADALGDACDEARQSAGVRAGKADEGSGITDVVDLEADRAFEHVGDQLVAVARSASPNGLVDRRLVRMQAEARDERAAAGAGEGVPAEGGFLVQKDFSAELFKRVYETGLLSGQCTRIGISGPSNGLKINGIDETSRANGSRWGGVLGYWKDEGTATTATAPKFRQMNLDLNKLFCLFYSTEELLADAPALGQLASMAFNEEMGFKLDDAIYRGTGSGQPLGIIDGGNKSKVEVAKETGQLADTILAQNIFKMWSRCYGRSRSTATWYINQEIEPQLFGMTLAVGTGGIPVYMPAGGLAAAPYGTLMGRPVVPIEQASALGDVGDIVLADMSQYLLIDKGGIKADSSIHVRFLYDESAFRFILRADGQPFWNSPLTPYKGASTNTLSPFVALAARA